IGACELAGAFFEIQVPVILRRLQEPGETIWLVFPIDLQPEEDPMSWFVAPPNFTTLESALRITSVEQAAKTGGLLRRIHSDLMTAKRPDAIAIGLGEKIQSHINSAAKHLTDRRKPMFGLAVWESHQAV